MYRFDWVERLKQGTAGAAAPGKRVSPVVWMLGLTSLLTDVSAEMVNAALPVYVMLHLRLGPMPFGVIDAIQNGLAIALLSLVGGIVADRTGRYRQVALAGYGASAVCKLGLLLAGGAWGWIAAVVAADRTAKGARTAPRDALLSLHSEPEVLASAFAVHRALDAGGAFLGPMAAFALMAWLPGAFDAIWVTSFVFALLGLAVLRLFVPNPAVPRPAPAARPSFRAAFGLLRGARFRSLAGAGALLAAFTVSDAFVYLVLQQRTGLAANLVPLLFVATAGLYVAFSIPVGRLADRWGRERVFLLGYASLGGAYLVLLASARAGGLAVGACVLLLGLYYAATEGILTAMASAVIPPEMRTSGLAVQATVLGLAKMVASLAFGAAWSALGPGTALVLFACGLGGALAASGVWLRRAAA